jgi:small subunit ribosomal protein S5
MAKPRQHRQPRKTPEQERQEVLDSWKPRTELGKRVLSGEITSIGEALNLDSPIMEPEIADSLMPGLQSELLAVGQMKGKFGGGKRRAFRQTQKKTKEGNSISFSTLAAVGNRNGYVGIGIGKSKETIPAREKAFRNARLNIVKVRRSTGGEGNPHTIPFRATGKCGSSEITLMPAPRGTGLVVEKECQKLLKLAGIEDVWSQTHGQTKVKFNLISACMNALKECSEFKISPEVHTKLGVVDGEFKREQRE